MIDIVAIKQAVKQGQLKAYVKNGKIYLQDDIDEVVEIGSVEQGKWDFIGYQMFKCASCGVAYTQKQLSNLKIHNDDPELPKWCPNCGSDMRR